MMTKRRTIANILLEEPIGSDIKLNGWVRTFRSNRFIALNDGSTIHSIQVVLDFEKMDEGIIKSINTGAAIEVHGKVVESQGKGQKIEVEADNIIIHGECDPNEYPLQPKRHSMEFLREKAHFRIRTNTFSAVFRIRHAASYAIHKFFNDEGFFMMHTPIITGSDAEGAGEMFRVTTLDIANTPKTEDGKVDVKQDFFAKEANLTVSGQLEAELGALGLGKVYTFGPTFRAENSNTSRHLAEFWMIEPEIAFADLNDDMQLAEDMMKYVMKHVLENCADDLKFLNDREIKEESLLPMAQRREMSLLDRLKFVLENEFTRITVILTDYPAEIKAFYMRQNDDNKTVAAMDVLFPGIGEIIGGSQREERLDVLLKKCKDFDIEEEHVWWYLETRKFGTCKHAGFGLGFERLVMFLTGMTNVRDVIPFPRTPQNAEF